MIGKVARGGNGFRGLYRYLIEGKKAEPDPDRVRWSSTRNLGVEDPNLAPRLMRATANESARCEKPAYHLVVSWRQDENPTDDLMRLVGDSTLADLGLEEHQSLLIAHDDTAHRHLHIVVNRVHPATGKAWHTGKDYARLETSMARQAKEHGFIVVPGRHNDPDKFKDVSKRAKNSEVRMAERKGTAPLDRWSKEEIVSRRKQLAPIIDGARSWGQLQLMLREQGLHFAPKGQGLVISDGMGSMKLSDLGKDVRLKGLEDLYGEPFADYAARAAMEEAQRRDVPEMQAPASSRKAVEKRPLRTTKPPRPVRTDSEAADDDDYQSGNGQSHSHLSDDEKQRLRDEARQRRLEERDRQLAEREAARATAEAADDDGQADSPLKPAPRTEPHQPPSTRRGDAMEDNPRRLAADRLGHAHEALSLVQALGSLAREQDLTAALEEVKRAKEELSRHLNMNEWMEDGVAEALREKPKETPKDEGPSKSKPKTVIPDHDREEDDDEYER